MMRIILASAAVLFGAVPPGARAAAGPGNDVLAVTFDERGLASITQGGHGLMAPEDARVLFQYVRFPNPKAAPGFDQVWEPKPKSASFDPAARTLTQVYDFGEVRVTWKQPSPGRLEWEVRVSNAGERPIGESRLFVGTLRLPRDHDTIWSGENLGTGRVFRHPGGNLALLNPPADPTPPLSVSGRDRLPKAAADGTVLLGGRITLATSFPRESRHPIVDNALFRGPGSMILPGKKVTWKFAVAAAAKPADLAPLLDEVRRLQAKASPMVLDWKDRRPVGTVFWAHPAQGWPKNPRGFNFGRGSRHDVFSEEGRRVFREELLAYVDGCVANCKAMDAQGVIVWDLEGEENPHMVSYLGDPRALRDAAPEMDALADEVFKRFKDAGLRGGVTLRPTEVFRREPGKSGSFWHRDVKDPVQLMADKIAYAKKRWGCTIFYLDSNVFGDGFDTKLPPNHGVPFVMPSSMLAELLRRHPDVLIIPEWSNGEDHRYAAPYSSPNLRQMCSSPDLHAVWPSAFRVVAVATGLMRDHWSNFLYGAGHGDILLFPCWYAAEENALVKAAYAEAALSRAVPDRVARAAPGGLPALASDPGEAVRYHAALALGRAGRPESAAVLARLLDDPSVLVRRAALEALAACRPRDAALVERLAGLVARQSAGLESILRPFAADALGACGEAGVPALAGLLKGAEAHARPFALRALAASGTQDAAAVEALLGLAGPGFRRGDSLQEPAVEALGRLKAKAAVPVLLGLLKDRERDSEFVRMAAAKALGLIGDRSAVDALLQQMEVPYSTVAVYSIPRVLDEALAALTGERGILGRDEWRAWKAKSAAGK
jgi:HEAT repeat protein